MNKLKQPSGIVFILIAITACVGFILKILSPEQFMILAVCAFQFYFNKPKDFVNNSTTSTSDDKVTSIATTNQSPARDNDSSG